MANRKEIQDYILAGNETFFSLDAILTRYDYADIAAAITQLANEDRLQPVKSSKQNGMRPALYHRYRRIKPKTDYSGVLAEIRSLPAFVSSDFYKKHPDQYLKDRHFITSILAFWQSPKSDMLVVACSWRERSLQIFGEEKSIQNGGALPVLRRLGIDRSMLNCYETPEPFVNVLYAQPIRNVLISENKDPFYALKEIGKGSLTVLEIPIDLLIYGRGADIEASLAFLADFTLTDDAQILYWGDLDYPGISIFQRLAAKYPELRIRPFTHFYELMMQYGEAPPLATTCKTDDCSSFLSHFSPAVDDRFREILTSGQRLPQEILSAYHLSHYHIATRRFP